MEVLKNCPGCHYDFSMEVDEAKYQKYITHKGLLQDIFPDLDVSEREFLKSGYCPNCQESIFGKTYTGKLIKEVE